MLWDSCFILVNISQIKYKLNEGPRRVNLQFDQYAEKRIEFSMYKLSLVLVVAAFGASQAAQWENGTCPDLASLPRFLPGENLLEKTLYERKTINNFIFGDEGRCSSQFNTFSNGVLSAIYEQINKDNETERAYGVASTVDDPDFMEKKIFNFRFFGEHLQPIELQAVLLATDQNNYAVTYACKQITDPDTEESRKLESVGVYTAKRGDTKYDRKIERKLEKLGLDYDSFKETDQSDCP